MKLARRRTLPSSVIKKRTYWQRIKTLLGSSMIGYWPLWETSGTTATDISGNGYNAAYLGIPVFGAVGIGDGRNSVNLNTAGYTNIYSAGLASAFNSTEGLLSFWLAAPASSKWTDGTGAIFAQGGADTNNKVLMRNSTGGDIEFFYTGGGTATTVTVGPQSGLRWIHFAFSWSFSEGKTKIYINGTKHRMSAITAWVGSLATSFMVGAGQAGGSKFSGRMAHVVLASSPLTDTKVRQIAQTNGQVVFVGDSRTNGKAWPFPSAETAFPNGLLGYGGRGVGNYGVSGYTMLQISSDATTIDALLIPGQKNVLVLWAGVNMGTDTTGAQIYARIQTYCLARRAAGWKIVICTEIDAMDATHVAAGWHGTVWPALNTLLAADHSFADGYADLGAIPQLQDATNSTYFSADLLHPNTTGFSYIPPVVSTQIALLG